MLKRLAKWLRKVLAVEPGIWAIMDFNTKTWHKVVIYAEPVVEFQFCRTGPFRSLLECEEYCDRRNRAMTGRVKLYLESLRD
jgi:hypothetical protein